MDFTSQTCCLKTDTDSILHNRYRQMAPPCLHPVSLQFANGSTSHLWSDNTPVMANNDSVTNIRCYLPSPIPDSCQPSVFTFDSSPPVYNTYSSTTTLAGYKRPRAEAVERLLSKFPKLRHMLEEEEAIADNTTATCFEPISCSTPTFYSGLEIPSIDFTPTIASSFMEEECDVGYSSYSDQAAYASPCTYEAELDSVLADINFANIATTESQILDAFHGSEDMFASSYIKIETDTAHDRAKYHCTLCSKTFVTKKNLDVHMRRHGSERHHKCLHCGKGFAQKSSLRTHMRTHTGERPYKCSMCPKAFSDFSTYTKHNRTHTGERPYTCDICGKGFAQSGNMIRHRQVHQKNGH